MNEDRATRYQRLRRRTAVAGAAASGALLAALLLTGASRALRAGLEAWTGGWWSASAAYLVLVFVIHEALLFPLAFYRGVVLERRYGLLRQSPLRWLTDHAKRAALVLLAVLVAGSTVLLCLRWTPEWWWVCVGVAFSVAVVGLSHLAPALAPLGDLARPLARVELRQRIFTLARRAGTPVVGVFEWPTGGHTRKANAVVAGFGRYRRVLVSDTLLDSHADDEIEVILAHELAHHVHHDLPLAVVIESGLVMAGAFVADRLLTLAVPVLGFDGKADAAALPLLALAVGAVSVVLMPAVNALSRLQERRADRYALELTGNAQAFVTAMKRLSANNLIDDRPSRLVQWLFHTHPPVGSRIAAAQAWAVRHR